MKITLVLMLVAASCFAADVTFVCDDSGSSSNFATLAPTIINAMSPLPTYEVVTNNGDTGTYTADADWWADQSVVIWYSSGTGDSGRVTTAAEAAAAETFINDGGWLLVTGYDQLGSPDDPNMATLLRSATYGDGPFQGECTIENTGHFIVNGDYGAFSGDFTVSGTDHDMFSPDTAEGCIEVISLSSTIYSKVIDCAVGDGHVTGWNGNDYSSDWTDIADCANMLRNWIDEALGDDFNVVETSWGNIKAQF